MLMLFWLFIDLYGICNHLERKIHVSVEILEIRIKISQNLLENVSRDAPHTKRSVKTRKHRAMKFSGMKLRAMMKENIRYFVDYFKTITVIKLYRPCDVTRHMVI